MDLFGTISIIILLLTMFSVNSFLVSRKLISKQIFSNMSTADTVVSRCTTKIQQFLQPLSIKVTSTNDDPNGSHVNAPLYIKIFILK